MGLGNQNQASDVTAAPAGQTVKRHEDGTRRAGKKKECDITQRMPGLAYTGT